MDDAPHFAAVFCPYRHYIPAVAQRDDGILQELIGGGIFDDRVKLGADRILSCTNTAAQVPQCHAGGIGHFFG